MRWSHRFTAAVVQSVHPIPERFEVYPAFLAPDPLRLPAQMLLFYQPRLLFSRPPLRATHKPLQLLSHFLSRSLRFMNAFAKVTDYLPLTDQQRLFD
jgi:hypothetical protein